MTDLSDVGLVAALAGFVGGSLSRVLDRVLDRRLGKHLDEAEMSRDLVVQLASALDGLASHLAPLTEPQPDEILSRERLADLHGGFDLGPPALSLEKLLASFASPEVHRLLILFYNRLALYEKRSEQHRTAYYWLLDSPLTTNWDEPAGKERVATIRVCRSNMFVYAQDLLQFGWEIVDRVLDNADSLGAMAMRGDVAPYRTFLETQYGLTSASAKLRRAYYASRPGVPLPSGTDHVLVTWDDEIARRLGGGKARLGAVVNQESRARSIPAFTTVALPRIAVLREVQVL